MAKRKPTDQAKRHLKMANLLEGINADGEWDGVIDDLDVVGNLTATERADFWEQIGRKLGVENFEIAFAKATSEVLKEWSSGSGRLQSEK